MSKGHSNALGNFICRSAQFRPNFGILAMILSQARYSEARMFLHSIRRNGVGPSIAAVVVRSGQNTTERNSRDGDALGSLAIQTLSALAGDCRGSRAAGNGYARRGLVALSIRAPQFLSEGNARVSAIAS
jgi:hypothetical protein